MRLVIFGASGATGRETVKAALARGHQVTAFVRRPESADSLGTGVRLATGDVREAAAVAEAIGGQDAVVSALGTVDPAAVGVCSTGTRHMVEAMRTAGVARLLCVTGAMIGYPDVRLGLLYRLILGLMPAPHRRLIEDRRLQERLVRESSLDWTLVRPPRLADGPARARLRVGEDVRVGWLASIARADLAQFIVSALDDRQYLRRAVTVVS